MQYTKRIFLCQLPDYLFIQNVIIEKENNITANIMNNSIILLPRRVFKKIDYCASLVICGYKVVVNLKRQRIL